MRMKNMRFSRPSVATFVGTSVGTFVGFAIFRQSCRQRMRQRSAPLRTPHSSPLSEAKSRLVGALRTSRGGFTMIEIAISLGIIAFALVAIIGILPFGMGVQRENREETIINQDTSILLDAIRNGDQGLDNLANYVLGITNTQTWYPVAGQHTTAVYKYINFNSWTFAINPGAVIVGLLSTPKYVPVYSAKQPPQFEGFYSNHIVATIRSMSGSASDKPPQNNASVADMAFTYRLISEVVPYGAGNPQAPYSSAWYPLWTNNAPYTVAQLRYANNLQADLYEVRLLFRWPASPNGALGSGRQAVRAVTTGPLLPLPNPPANPRYTLYFVQPKTFVRAQ